MKLNFESNSASLSRFSRYSYKVLAFVFVILFSVVWIFCSNYSSYMKQFWIVFVLLIFAWMILAKPIASLTRRAFYLFIFFLSSIILIFSCIMAYQFQQDLSNYPLDVTSCHLQALQLSTSTVRPAEWNNYFLAFNTNTFFMLFLYWVYNISVFFTGTASQSAAYLVNVVLLQISIACIAGTGFLLRRRPGLIFSLVLCLLFLPFYFMLALPYTDSFSLPFSTGGIFLYLLAINYKPVKARYLCYFFSFLVLSLGFLMKGNLVVLLIATSLHQLVFTKYDSIMKRLIIFLSAFAILLTINQVFWFILRQSGLIDFTAYDAMHLPWSHWIMMGLVGNGSYDQASYDYTFALPGLQAKSEATRAQILVYLKAYLNNPSAAWNWFIQKNQLSWIIGDYGSAYYATIRLIRGEIGNTGILNAASYWMTGFHIMIYSHMILLGIISLFKRKPSRFLSLLFLTLFGMYVFLLLWEANSRYAFNISFLGLLCLLWALPVWDNWIRRFLRFIRLKFSKITHKKLHDSPV